ncbi:hypothetical protein BDN72DRAFT_846173 [Pluteus cervinus]|uniref:Uncharacterized protein n=1 Tax=Pluteus cervinus TaxID=181527 RepID=A0ACD3AH62_9AGAR|nr:hypothetical protein BDN72DRAFT_846173 [Pluteus cervinus]
MSTSQHNNIPQGSQRVDEVPVVPTKAKMNQVLARSAASTFGMDSMFESTRQRQPLADEDAPPTASITDIPTEVYPATNTPRFQPKASVLEKSTFRRHGRASSQSSGPQFVIIFGYPPDKYTVTAEYFKSLGESTEPDANTDIVNCFRIGYLDAGDAMRAVRKNGEVLGGTWMIGVKWADPAQAEFMLNQPFSRSAAPVPVPESSPNAMAVDDAPSTPHLGATTPTVGTPIRLAPSTSAFRRTGGGDKPLIPQPQGWAASQPALANATPNASPTKGMLGQVSDLIFGW